MTRKFVTRKLVLVAAVAFVLSAKPTWAQPPEQTQCMTKLTACYYWAATLPNFWAVWAGGLDCELTAINCVRMAIFGH